MQPPSRPLVRSGSAGSNFPRAPETPNQQAPARPITNGFPGAQNHAANQNSRPPPQGQFNQTKPPVPQHQHRPVGQNNAAPPQPPGGAAPPPSSVGFFSARAVKGLLEEAIVNGNIAPQEGQTFNPKAESPSIRKTPGIDHTKSKPVARNGQHVPSATGGDASVVSGSPGARAMGRPGPPMGRGNIVNPQLDQTRRIGAPGQSSPLANRGQYRPPTMKRPASEAAQPGNRQPLADLPSNGPPTAGDDMTNWADSKRQRVG